MAKYLKIKAVLALKARTNQGNMNKPRYIIDQNRFYETSVSLFFLNGIHTGARE